MTLRISSGFVAATIALAVAGGGAGAPASAQAASLKSPKDRKPAPGFMLKDSDGRMVKLADYRGRVVLLNFWATNCGPCKIEIPWFVEFERKFKDRGFAVLGVSLDDEGWDIVKPFLSRFQVNYRVLLGDEKVAAAYGGVDALPTTFLIDRAGRIGTMHVGLVSRDVYQGDIVRLLERRAELDIIK